MVWLCTCLQNEWSPFMEGFEAAIQWLMDLDMEKPVNPYAPGTAEHDSWNDGFDDGACK